MEKQEQPRTYSPDELVVAFAHRERVLAKVVELDGGAAVTKKDAVLGLAMIGFHTDRVETGLRRVESTHGERFGKPGSSTLDRLLDYLRSTFATECSGWTPTLGKNRSLWHVSGARNVIGGGDEGVPGSSNVAALPDRAGDPGLGVRVGVADTALFRNEWLVDGYDVAPASVLRPLGPNVGAVAPAAGHATFVTGTILQRAPGASVSLRRVLDESASAESWDVATELVRFARSGIDIINLSFGCFTDDDRSPLVLATAIDRLGPDVVIVAAAGNHRQAFGNRPLWPAALDDVIAVGATTADGELAPFSPEPDKAPWLDVLATGVDVTSTYFDAQFPVLIEDNGQQRREKFNGFATWNGTSFGAGFVSGEIAARTVPGRLAASAAFEQLTRDAPRRAGLPWVR